MRAVFIAKMHLLVIEGLMWF